MSDYFEFKGIKVKRRAIDERTKSLIPVKRFFILENEQIEEILYAIEKHEENEPWNILLVGEPGCGKSMLICYLCAELNIPLIQIQGDGEMSVADLVGCVAYNKDKGGTYWQDGKIPYGLRNKCSFLFDEMNGILPDVLMKTHSMLDDRRVLDLKEHIVEQELNGEKVEIPENVSVPKETVFFGTQNPFGQGRHVGTKPLSPALESRFGMRINVDYLSVDSETKMLIHETGIGSDDAKKIVTVANESRKAFQKQEISTPIDHRGTKMWASLTKRFGLARACRTTILNKMEEEDFDVLRGILLAYNLEKPESGERSKKK